MHFSKTLRFRPSPTAREAGFTLAEVALAMAIFSFALVSVLGLLSVGLKTTRKANLQTAASSVLSAIAADIQAAKFDGTSGTDVYTTPTLNIVISVDPSTQKTAVSPTSLVVTDGGTDAATLSMADQGALKIFDVKITAPAAPQTGLRVQVSWPHKRTPTAATEGFLESLIPVPVQN